MWADTVGWSESDESDDDNSVHEHLVLIFVMFAFGVSLAAFFQALVAPS